MNKVVILIACCAVSLMACGGDEDELAIDVYELEPSRTIESLNLKEARAFCQVAIEEQGGAGTQFECDGFELTVQSVEECAVPLADATCTNTVGELHACLDVLVQDPCALVSAPECSFLWVCVTGEAPPF